MCFQKNTCIYIDIVKYFSYLFPKYFQFVAAARTAGEEPGALLDSLLSLI